MIDKKIGTTVKSAKVISCTCRHTYQDNRYGVHKRLHNFGVKLNNGVGGWKCTVCENVKVK